MANFSDYEKHFQKIREGIQEQISLDWHNVKLHIEQLRLSNKYFKQYEYLCILKDLELAEKYLDEAQSMIDGFETCPEEDVPEEMIFKSETERKAEAFEEILERSHKDQWPEEFGEDVWNIIDKYRENDSIKTDQELDKEPEEIPEQETIFDDSKNGVEGFNEFLKKLK